MSGYSSECEHYGIMRADETIGPMLEGVEQITALLEKIEERLLENDLAGTQAVLNEISDCVTEIDWQLADAEAAEERERRDIEEAQRDSAIWSYAHDLTERGVDTHSAAEVAAFFLRKLGHEAVGELVADVLKHVETTRAA